MPVKNTPHAVDDSKQLNAPEVPRTTNLYAEHLKSAELLLKAYHSGEATAIKQFEQHHPQGQDSSFVPNLQDARLIVSRRSTRVNKLSLEKLKKNAKSLLRQLQSNNPTALDRFQRFHPKSEDGSLTITNTKLADAQLVLARENGLPSWPKLKQHVEVMSAAANNLGKTTNIENGLKTLHIRCGNDIQSALKQCGFVGDFLEISNPFPLGQVPASDPLDTFLDARTQFINNTFQEHVPRERLAETRNQFANEEKQLRQLPGDYQRIALWFEHDPYDQLCLAYVLHHLVKLKESDSNFDLVTIELIQINQFPGVKRFIGIGQLCQQPESLAVLWQQRKIITPTIIAFGARIWNAFTGQDPTSLWQLSNEKSTPLPFMQSAIKRILLELPSTKNGLGLSEQLALEILALDGPMTAERMFHFLHSEREPQPYLGDIMFLSILNDLWNAKKAAIKVVQIEKDKPLMQQPTLALTTLGQRLLEGEENWLTHNKIDRWIGGVRISTTDDINVNNEIRNWYWCSEHEKPILK